MRAFVVEQSGSQTVVKADVGIPHIDENELLVRVHAVGVGIHDSYFLPRDANYPYPIGIEAAGVIEEVGAKVLGRSPGERISFVSAMQPKGGTWAEFAAVRADSLILPIPSGLDFVQATAIPVAGNTALKALHALSEVPEGGSVFIAGGSGAIGTLAIQLARERGWRVAASSSKTNHEYMRKLGAHAVVDYTDPQWQKHVSDWAPGGVDAALAIQPSTAAESLALVKDGGRVVSISGENVASTRGISVVGVPQQIDVTAELSELMEKVARAGIHLELEKVYRFDDALAALAKVQTRHARGKIVLSLT